MEASEPAPPAPGGVASPLGTAGEEAEAAGGPEHPEEGLVAPAGKFRIYLGAAAGVGKTVAMLDEGWRRHERGRDVVIGFVETHGRSLTGERMRTLEVVPRKLVAYRGTQQEEMDLDAILARRPGLALIDEMAHTNVPGSGRHAKRWEDILEILEHGINVISTVNIQHLESLADSVERMTGTTIRERVPDWVVRRADQIELIDSSPEQLRRRLLHGHVYPPERVQAALTHFFNRRNLTILRELALRFVADETEEQLLRAAEAAALETCEHILVAVAPGDHSDQVLRRAARMAARAKGDLCAVHVLSEDPGPASGPAALHPLQELTQSLGGSWDTVAGGDVADALVQYARAHHMTQLVVGSPRSRRWRRSGDGLIRRVVRRAAEAGLDVHIIAPAGRGADPAPALGSARPAAG